MRLRYYASLLFAFLVFPLTLPVIQGALNGNAEEYTQRKGRYKRRKFKGPALAKRGKRKKALKSAYKAGAGKALLLVFLAVGVWWGVNHFFESTARPLGEDIDIDHGENITGVPHLKPKTPVEVAENVVHAMCLPPERFPRKSGRGACVHYRRESFFRSSKAYATFLASLLKVCSGTLEERKKKLVEDACNIVYKQYDLSLAAFETTWTKEFRLPKTLDAAVCPIQEEGEAFPVQTHYIGADGVGYPLCTPGFQNKNFGGGYIDGACAYEEFRWYGAPAEAVVAELIKIEALKEAIRQGKGEAEAYELRKVQNRAYIFDGITSYMKLGHYGTAFTKAPSFREVKEKLAYYDSKKLPRFHMVAAAAPDRETGAGRAGEPCMLKHIKLYVAQAYIASYAQTCYFLKEKEEKSLYKALGNFGAGAFPYPVSLPYLAQLFAYVCEGQESEVEGKVRLMLYPFDKVGMRGLNEAKELWLEIVKEAGDKVSLERFCELAIECAEKRNRPLVFHGGNGS